MKPIIKLREKFILNIEDALRKEAPEKGYRRQDIAPAIKAVRYCVSDFNSFESDMQHERARTYISIPKYTRHACLAQELYDCKAKDNSMNALTDLEGIRESATVVALLNKYAGSIKSKKVLDIGCGIESSEFYKTDGFRPWLARGLSYLGAHVTGIDKLESENEHYNHISANLVKNKLSDILKSDKKFDIVIARHFFDSPHLEYSLKPQTAEERNKELEDFTKGGKKMNASIDEINKKRLSFANRLIREISELTENKGIFMEKSCSDLGINDIISKYDFHPIRQNYDAIDAFIWRKEK